MKKILLLALVLIGVNSYSYVERSEQVGNRGLELIRENNINQNMGLSQLSGSTQIIDAYVGNGKYEKTKGLMIGTASNFVAYPNITAAVTIAYDKDYDLNTYFSYMLDKNLFEVGFGYSQARHVEKRAYSGNLEAGRFLTGNTYLYTGVEGQNRIYKKSNMENLKFANYKLGLMKQDTWKKFKFVNGVEVNFDNKKYDDERARTNFTFFTRTSYYIHEALLIDLQYRGTKNSRFYNSVVGIGFTHNF